MSQVPSHRFFFVPGPVYHFSVQPPPTWIFKHLPSSPTHHPRVFYSRTKARSRSLCPNLSTYLFSTIILRSSRASLDLLLIDLPPSAAAPPSFSALPVTTRNIRRAGKFPTSPGPEPELRRVSIVRNASGRPLPPKALYNHSTTAAWAEVVLPTATQPAYLINPVLNCQRRRLLALSSNLAAPPARFNTFPNPQSQEPWTVSSFLSLLPFWITLFSPLLLPQDAESLLSSGANCLSSGLASRRASPTRHWLSCSPVAITRP